MENGLKRYKKRIVWGLIFYGILSLGVIPIFTLFMGTKDNILTVSMSAMGSSGGGVHIWFIIWTVVFCAFFASFVSYLLMLTKNTHSKIRGFVYFAIAVLLFGNFLPFIPDVFPWMAYLHNFCAQISSVSLAVILMLFALTLRNSYTAMFKKALVFVLIIWAVLIVMMGIFGTKSITEMTGIILAGVFLFTVLIWLYQEDSFDPVTSLQEFDADTAQMEADKLEKRAAAAKKEYLRLEQEARHARLKADEVCRMLKANKHS